MKYFLLTLALTTVVQAQAAPEHYKVESQVMIGNKLVASPVIVTKVNDSAEVTSVTENPHSEFTMKVYVTEKPDSKTGMVNLKFDISYESGKTKFKGTPEVLTKPGSEAIVKVLGPHAEQQLRMKVIATKQ